MKWIGRILGRKTAKRMYAGARNGRMTLNASTSSADAELYTSLSKLRDRSRTLCRDNAHAKRARVIVVNNVIGQGVGMQAQITNNRGRLVKEVNDPIESAWDKWCQADTCHTGGELHFADFERAAMSEIFVAGEVFIRKHRRAFGAGRVPLALELIESERVADNFEIKPPSGARVTMGIEHDEFNRPIAYYFHKAHPHQLIAPPGRGFDEIIRVPAEDVIHLRVIDRWPQTRGEPWLHAAITRLHQLGEFDEAAVIAARIGAEKVMMLKETEDGRLGAALGDETGAETNDGTLTWNSGKGQVDILPSGTDVANWAPQYPHEQYDPFTRACMRGIAAGIGVSYESLSRDYSQSNYSSSRMGLLDDRDLWRVVQSWWMRSFRRPLHTEWLQAAVLSRAVPLDLMAYGSNPDKYEAVKFKPRGWTWVDPTKEVTAYKEAEKAGYITKTDIIAATAGGQDIEDIVATRRAELDLLEDNELVTDTVPSATQTSLPSAPADVPTADDEDSSPPARLFAMKRDANE